MRTLLTAMMVALVTVAAVASCQNRLFVEELQRQSGTQRILIPIESVSKTDILFLVDNSGSMAQEQATLAASFAVFIDKVLEGQNDFHIGIVTTDVTYTPLAECEGSCGNGMDCVIATSSSDAVQAGKSYCTLECQEDADCPDYHCSTIGDCTPSVCGKALGFVAGKSYCYPMNNGRLRYANCKRGACEYDGAHVKVLTNRVRDTVRDSAFQAIFRDNVKVGTNGTGFEKGLQALRNALDSEYRDPVTGDNLVDHENTGFLRADARLTLIVVTDEEDCSYPQLDPGFDNDHVNPAACYPDPGSCHPDCAQVETVDGESCLAGWSPVEAIADAGVVGIGRRYCMYPCTSQADCEVSATVPLEGLKCAAVDGFGAQTYCSCNFIESQPNPDSQYERLIPVKTFVDFFKSLKRDPDDVNMAVIVGAKPGLDTGTERGQPDNCASPNGVACAGRRYYEAASGMTRFLADSICQPDFSQTLLDIVIRLIVSNERALPDEPLDPSCIRVKVGGTVVPHCETLVSCETSSIDGGASTCPEADRKCESGQCVDKGGGECDCAAIFDPDRGCHCGSDPGMPCGKPIYWQYKPPSCPKNDAPKVVLKGCGLEPGDKLEINFMTAATTSGEEMRCE